MKFDSAAKADAEKEFNSINDMLSKDKKNKMVLYGSILLASILGAIISIIVIRRKKRKKALEEQESLLDIVIDDDSLNDTEMLKPIDFGISNVNTHKEEEIKKYASEKPDQVVEIVKSWLADNER